VNMAPVDAVVLPEGLRDCTKTFIAGRFFDTMGLDKS
jgi:hypothetical protein